MCIAGVRLEPSPVSPIPFESAARQVCGARTATAAAYARNVPAFDKPAFAYHYKVGSQIAALLNYEATKPKRAIPRAPIPDIG